MGFPILIYAFNDDLGWAHTVNVFDGVDHYELTLADGGYRWDGGVRAFETETVTLKVRQPDDSMREEPLRIERSIHGPVVARKGDKALALRVVGLDAPRALEQWWAMAGAHNLGEFEAAGDTYVAAIEFADPVRAKVLVGYGNATQPGSPHISDQLELYARKELRPVWRTRSEIEANLEFREVLR